MSEQKPWEAFASSAQSSATSESKPWEQYSSVETPKQQPIGVLGTLKEGAKSAARAIGSTVDTYTGNNQGVVDKAEAQHAAVKAPELQSFYDDVQRNKEDDAEDAGLWDGIKNVGGAIIDNPKGAGLAIVEQLPNSVPTLAGGYAGMKAGALAGGALGTVVPGVGNTVGAAVGGVIGSLTGMFIGNTAIETGHKAMGAADDGDFTNEEAAQVKQEGAIKGGVITAIDGLTLGLGGAVAKSMQRTATNALESATRKTLLDNGVDVADQSAVLAAKQNPAISKAVREAQDAALKVTDTFKRRAVEAGTLLGMESVGEGLGEYLGELAATGEADVTDAVMEAALSLGQSGAEAAWNMSRTRQQGRWTPADDTIQPMPTAENPTPAPVPRPDPNAGVLSRAANLLPAPSIAGALPAPDSIYVDGQGQASRDGVNKNVDGQNHRAQQEQSWVNPANNPAFSGGAGMDRQTPRGEPAPLVGDLITAGRQAETTPANTPLTIDGEVIGRGNALPAPSLRLSDQREQGIVVDAQGNASQGPLTRLTERQNLGGGAGMDQQARRSPLATNEMLEREVRTALTAGRVADAQFIAQRVGTTQGRAQRMIESVQAENTALSGRYVTHPQAKKVIRGLRNPERFEVVKGAEPKSFHIRLKEQANGNDRAGAADERAASVANNAGDGRSEPARVPVIESGRADTEPAAGVGAAVSTAAARPDGQRALSRGAARDPRRIVNRDNDSVVQAVIKLGGLKTEWRMDTTGDTKGNKHRPGVGALWTDKTGTSIDDMASLLEQHGYIGAAEMQRDGGVSWLQNAIRDEVGGLKTHYALGSAKQEADLIMQEAERYGFTQDDDWAAIEARIDAVFDLTDDVSSLAEENAELEARRIAHEAHVAELDRLFGDDDGRSTEETGTDPASRQRDPESGDAAGAGVGAQGAAEPADSGAGSLDQGEGSRTETAGDRFALAQQTEQELAEQAAAQAAAERAEAEQARAEQQRAQADRDANDFTLTGSDHPSDVAAARGQNDMFAPQTRGERKAAERAKSIAGESIDSEWTLFTADSGTLGIARAEMPQIKAEHRGAMVNFLNARDIQHAEDTVPAASLKPTQAEFSTKKVEAAKAFTGGDRSILISNDGHVLDGHHQWMAKRDSAEDVKVIRLDAPIRELLDVVAEFPSATQDTASQEQKPKATIEDAGEKLGGARKDELRTVRERLDSLSDEEIASSKLSDLWPKGEIDKIEDTFHAATYHAVREHIPTKPRVSYRLKSWVDKVKVARMILVELSQIGAGRSLKKMRESSSVMRAFADKVEVLMAVDRKHWDRIGKVTRNHGQYRKGDEMVPGSWVNVEIDGRTAYFRGHETVESAMPEIAQAIEQKDAPEKKMKFAIYSDRQAGDVFITQDSDKERRRLKSFADVKTARAYLSDHYDDLVAAWDAVKNRDNVTKADIRRQTNERRTGRDYRGGKDVTPEQFLNEFGFRGVEFGNWVKQGAGGRERQGMLNEAYDAFMDLADIVGVPPKSLSLEGRLGIGFGSRGRGNASAHFEPGNIVINLTKTKGAGSLAHEWFHALDHYFAGKRVRPIESDGQSDMQEAYITYRPEPLLVNKKFNMRMTRGELNRYQASHPGAQLYAEENWMADPRHPEGVRPQVEKAFAELVETLNASPMLKRSQIIDKYKANGYWSRIIERAARSFETYVISRLADQGHRDDYLANVVSFERFVRSPDRYPYLTPDEQGPVSEAFDKLFSTIESRETADGNIALYRQGANQVPTGTRAATLRKAIADVVGRWSNAPTVRVVQSVSDLPAHLQRRIEADQASGVEGIFSDSGVYLIADNLADAAHAQRVLLHEVIGHYGVRGLLGERTGRVMEQIYIDMPAEVKRRLERAYSGQLDGMNAAQRRQTVAEEYVAHLAETNPSHGLINRLVALIRSVLREVFGANLAWSRNDVVGLLANSGRFVNQGRAQQGTAAPAYRQQGNAAPALMQVDEVEADAVLDARTEQAFAGAIYKARGTDSPFFQRWFNGSRLVNKQGEPVAFYHRSFGELANFDDTKLGGNTGTGTALLGHFLARNDVGNVERYGPVSERFYVRMKKPKVVSQDQFEAMGDWSDTKIKAYRKTLMDQGFDGIYIQGLAWPVVFEGKNIKAARNAGTFDGSDRTRYSMAGGQFSDTEDAIGGRAAWQSAKDAGRTKLEYRQWVQVRTPAFKAWFGDWENENVEGRAGVASGAASRSIPARSGGNAAAADARATSANGREWRLDRDTGEPRVFYHGTKDSFTAFDLNHPNRKDKGWLGRGVYTASNKDLASGYSKLKGGSGEARVMDLFVNVRNPAVATVAVKQRLRGASQAYIDEVTANLRQKGFDGVVLTLPDGTIELMAFEPSSVKSATGNNGDFDPANPDIRYSLADREARDAMSGLGMGPSDADSLINKIRNFTRADFKALMSDWGRRSEEGLFDGMIGIKRAEEAVGVTDANQQGYVSARLSTGIADVMYAVMRFGAPQWKDGVVGYKEGTRGLLEVLADLGPNNLNTWLGWLGAKRAELLKAQGLENNLTDAEIAELLAGAKGKEELFERVYREYAQINEAVLDLAQEAGLIDKASREKWTTDYYVPFYRELEGENMFSGPRTSRGLSHQTAAIRALKGGDTATKDLLANILQGWSKRIDASMKNKAMLEVVENLKDSEFLSDESMRFQSISISRSQIAAHIRKDRKALKQAAKMLGLKETANFMQVSNELMKPSNEGFEKVWVQVAPTDPDIIRVQRDGKNEYYRVNDESLLRGLKAMGGTVFTDPVTTLGRKAKQLLTTGVTSSPDFILRNFIRDGAHAWVINPDGFKLFTDSMKGINQAFKEDPHYREMSFAGASFQGGYIHGGDPDAAAQMVRRALREKGMSARDREGYMNSLVDSPAKMASMLKTGWEKYRGVSDKVENANRLATYKRAREAGKSPRQAAFESKDLMDFSMRGNFIAAQWFTDVVPFLNARMQGLYKLGRAAKGDKALLARHVAMKGGYLALFSLALAALNGDDERYKDLPDWDKDLNWHVFLGDAHFRIPKPFELGLVFGTMPERLFHTMLGEQDSGDLGRAVAHGVFETLGFNPVPQLVHPLREVQANRSFFRDAPIEDMSDEGKLPEARYDERTSAFSVWAGQATGPVAGVSPKQLDHLIKGYLGTMGAYALSMSNVIAGIGNDAESPDFTAADVPLVKVLYSGDVVRSSRYQAEFYDMLTEADQLHRTVKAYRENGKVEQAEALLRDNADKLRARPALGLARKQLGNIRNQMDAVHRDKTMTGSEKRERLNELQRRANSVAERVVRLAGDNF